VTPGPSSSGLVAGARAQVTVPATSANLGPGFDSLALALTLRDKYDVTLSTDDRITVDVSGESADELPRDGSHLVATAFVTALAEFGRSPTGFRLACRNAIPQGRGLGSSAAAIVGGVALAAVLADVTDPEAIVEVATAVEGHPDNVAAAVMGGLTVSWLDGGAGRAVSLPVATEVAPVLLVPKTVSPTSAARAALPTSVPHGAAAFNVGRSALLVAALTSEPELLYPATEDRLHQRQREQTYPSSLALVDQLRASKWAAVISGAGPSVLVLTDQPGAERIVQQRFEGFRALISGIGTGVEATRIGEQFVVS